MSLIIRALTVIIVLILTAAMLVLLLYLFKPMENTALMSKSVSLQLCNTINGMLMAPENTVKTYYLPAIECSVEIDYGRVTVTANENTYSSSFLIPDPDVSTVIIEAPSLIMCDDGKKLPLVFRKIKEETGEEKLEIKISE